MPALPKDSRLKQGARVAATTGIGALAGRVTAWHPVHGGRMNRGTLIGAGIGAATQIGAEKLSKRLEGDDKRVVKKSGIITGGIGLYAATAKAGKLGAADDLDTMKADIVTRATGRVSEKEAARQNAKARRAMGVEGETFIPRMPRLARETAKKAGFKIVTEDQTGGTIEDKLARLHQSAKGTPEGDAALRKLNELRQRQGENLTGKAKKMIAKITSRFAPKKVSKFAGHLLSAREELNEIVHFKIQINPENKGKFTATEERTGKTTAELAASKNPLTRKRAIFAQNMRKIAAKHKAEKKEMSARDELNSIIELKEIDPITEIAKKLISGKPALLMSARDQLDHVIKFGTVAFGPEPGVTAAIEAIMKRNAPGIRNTRGNILKKVLPDFPAPVGGGVIRRHGFVQKEAADALRKYRNRGPGFLTEGLSVRDELNQIIALSDPRPRNPLGEFTQSEEGTPSPNEIDSVYKQPQRTLGQNLAGGAVAGVGAAASGGALRALVNKLKKTK